MDHHISAFSYLASLNLWHPNCPGQTLPRMHKQLSAMTLTRQSSLPPRKRQGRVGRCTAAEGLKCSFPPFCPLFPLLASCQGLPGPLPLPTQCPRQRHNSSATAGLINSSRHSSLPTRAQVNNGFVPSCKAAASVSAHSSFTGTTGKAWRRFHKNKQQERLRGEQEVFGHGSL